MQDRLTAISDVATSTKVRQQVLASAESDRLGWCPLRCTSHGCRGLCSQAAYSIVGTAAEDAERRLNGPPTRLV